MKKMLAVFLAAVAVVGLTFGQLEAAEKYSLRISTSQTDQSLITRAYMKLADELNKRSEGRLDVKVFPSSQLGNDEDVIEQAIQGAGVAVNTDPARMGTYVKDMGILTVGIVTVPAEFEGPKRLDNAKKGVLRLKEYVDALIVINNQKIQQIYNELTISAAFDKANDVLNVAAKGIAEIITLPGYINVDFADVKTVMTNSGIAIMGAAKASGEGRARRVISEALNSPLLNKSDILGAKDILLNITSGTDEITMDEMTEITDYVIKEVGDTAAIIWGVGTDESLEEAISVTIIATGFPMDDLKTILRPVKKLDTDRQEPTPEDKRRTKGIDQGVREYVLNELKKENIALRPDLSPDKIEELLEVPAYKRRNLKINNKA